MSIITLLADFPNYSARKVRRLAKQISLVQRLSEMVALGQETGALKGIEADLLEFNLLQAKTEERLNDDLAHPDPQPKVREWWGHPTELPGTLEEAHDWINDMLDQWKQMAENMGFREFRDPEVLIERAKRAAPDSVTERINVCPTAAARRALDECLNWINAHTGPAPSHTLMTTQELRDKCNGIINGQSFYTDRTIIQARLSPQEDLPIDKDPTGAGF